ncbi:GNAT family N-acetyltransferase [Microbacterium sp. Mu-80]|uniref:GNAT family N-acetyltransferase n=1 Tax=Microbacterium bandirmense TaxID=3122050 RepID=A0ABU8L607_9MICO
MQTAWHRIDDDAERDERITAARVRLRRRREHAEQTETPEIAVADGEIWVCEEPDRGESITLWVRQDGPHTSLAEISTASADSAAVWDCIRSLALAQGWKRVTFSAYRGDDLASALAEHSGARRIATKMLQITDHVLLPQGIRTEPMSELEYAAYAAHNDRSYAEELLASGSAEEMDVALAEAAAAMGRLLPQGLQTPHQHLHTVRTVDGESVGVLWVHVQADRAFIYDIEMRDEVRGRGYGTQTLRAAAALAREAGRSRIALNVFGHNDRARRLYAREGYLETEAIWTVQVAD